MIGIEIVGLLVAVVGLSGRFGCSLVFEENWIVVQVDSDVVDY